MGAPAPAYPAGKDFPAVGGVALDASKSDSVALSETFRGLYVGVTGDVKLTMVDGSTPTFTALLAGQVYPFQFYQVFTTGTTATGLTGLR